MWCYGALVYSCGRWIRAVINAEVCVVFTWVCGRRDMGCTHRSNEREALVAIGVYKK